MCSVWVHGGAVVFVLVRGFASSALVFVPVRGLRWISCMLWVRLLLVVGGLWLLVLVLVVRL